MRPPCRPATRRRSTAARGPQPTPAAPSRHLPGRRRRHPHLHDHEQAAVLDGAGGEAVGGPGFVGDDLRRPERDRTVRRRDGRHRRTATAPRSTTRSRPRAFVGETAVPTDYTATIQCGAAAPGRTRAGRLRSQRLRPRARRSSARSRTASSRRPCESRSSGTARPRRRRSSSTRTGSHPSTPRRSPTADGDNTSFDYLARDGRLRRRDDAGAGRVCGHDPVRHRDAAALHRRPLRSHRPGPGATLTCTITNTQQLSTVQVIKQWDGAPASTTIFVDQDGVGALRRLTVATANGDSASFDYPLSTPAFVGETAVPTGYTATIQCGGATPQPYTGGPFAVTRRRCTARRSLARSETA